MWLCLKYQPSYISPRKLSIRVDSDELKHSQWSWNTNNRLTEQFLSSQGLQVLDLNLLRLLYSTQKHI